MGGLVRRYERGPHTESYGAEKEIGVCDVSQVFLLCTSHNPMRHLDVVEAKDCWQRLTEEWLCFSFCRPVILLSLDTDGSENLQNLP